MNQGSAPNSTEALVVLTKYLEGFDSGASRLGRDYFRSGQVRHLKIADARVEGQVVGSGNYVTALTWDGEKWIADCTCPVGQRCKHAYAVGLAWAQRATARVPDEAGRAGQSALKKIPPFAETWEPQLVEKLGREITPDERMQLSQLGALFSDFRSNGNQLNIHQLASRGFPVSEQALTRTFGYAIAFEGWWPARKPPEDPWALWQCIAYDWELAGREIPEIFRSMTDTSAVRAAAEEVLSQRELRSWREKLSKVKPVDTEDDRSIVRKISDVRLILREDGFYIETKLDAQSPWKPPLQKWLRALTKARPSDFAQLSPAASALAIAICFESEDHGYSYGGFSSKEALLPGALTNILKTTAAHAAIFLDEQKTFAIEPTRLELGATVSNTSAERLEIGLITAEGVPAPDARIILEDDEPLYLHENRVYRGPPKLPGKSISKKAINDPALMTRFRALGLRLPESIAGKVKRVPMRPKLRLWIAPAPYGTGDEFCAELTAYSDSPKCTQVWTDTSGWTWAKNGAIRADASDGTVFDLNLDGAAGVAACFPSFNLEWSVNHESWARSVTRTFADDFTDWHASLPPDIEIEADDEIASLLSGPLRATLDFSAKAAEGSSRDWFDITVDLRVEDTTLTKAEIALLLRARGKWVNLPKHGWRRLEIDNAAAATSEAAATLDRLGLTPAEVFASGKSATHRLHALQLSAEASALAKNDAALAELLRTRAAEIAAQPPPALPTSLKATLRPYQLEGFHFLAHLSRNGFGGVLADDMGLGKTVQTLAWLLHQAEKSPEKRAPFRALVVCPKSVIHGWLTETNRFAPSLRAVAFDPDTMLATSVGESEQPMLVVANYVQLRINAVWFKTQPWDAVVLDEAQFIKNPSSATAVVARGLPCTHRVALTGTPIENRLLDLWSLFAFAQPGLLSTQTAFKRDYPSTDPLATARLRRRVRHFMLRRTKGQVATDLPPRTEDEIIVDLEGEQRRLYDAELKRARAQLLGINTPKALDSVRFNVLASLMRLRQICCHPALVDPAHRELPSAKLDALIERIEELDEEGHQVLVFSQFVEMLELIRARLITAKINHLMLTGQTEDRQTLVEKFQNDRTQTVFLLSLKAAGFGLNLTAASYAILYDPWWNPAVEAQAIDRTHRIGQTRPVIAYRVIAANTVEEKIRSLQKEKADLAAAVVQEESLASVLDLDSLKEILS